MVAVASGVLSLSQGIYYFHFHFHQQIKCKQSTIQLFIFYFRLFLNYINIHSFHLISFTQNIGVEIVHRSRLQQTMEGTGRMAAVGVSKEQAKIWLEPYGEKYVYFTIFIYYAYYSKN